MLYCVAYGRTRTNPNPYNVYEIQSIVSFKSRRAHGENLRGIKQTRAEAEAALSFAIESGTSILKSIKAHSKDSITGVYTFDVEWLDGTTSWEPSTNLKSVTVFEDYVTKKKLRLSA